MKPSDEPHFCDDADDPLAWTRMEHHAWYVLITSPLAERAVANRLMRRIGGVLAYVPMVRRRVQRMQRREISEHLVMPRYLLVGFAQEVPWLFVGETVGVQGVLGTDGTPRRVAARLVGEVISKCESGFYAPVEPGKVQKGMSVVATGGTMRGFEGDVVGIDRRRNAADVVFLFGGERPVRISLDDVVLVPYPTRRMIG